jgi:hypothetical protein
MATVTPGSGGTIKSSTIEGQVVETITLLQLMESDTSKNSSGRNAITINLNLNTNEFVATFAIPVSQGFNPDGSIKLSAQTYLTGVNFAAGSGGTFKSTTLEAYTLEVMMALQFQEQQTAKNPQARNLISGAYDIDTGLYSGALNLPITYTLLNGSIEITAVEYLLT